MVKTCLPMQGDVRDAGSIPGSGRSPRGGHGTQLQYSCLENPTDRGAWWSAVHKQLGVTQATQHAHQWKDREGSWKDSSPAAGRPLGVGTLWPCDPALQGAWGLHRASGFGAGLCCPCCNVLLAVPSGGALAS